MLQEENNSFPSISSMSSGASSGQSRRKVPLVPKFDSTFAGPSLPERKSFNVMLPERNEADSPSAVRKNSDNKIEEEVEPGRNFQNLSSSGLQTDESKDDNALKSKQANPIKMPAFVPNIDLQFINKLYADKDLANKEGNKEPNKDKKETKKHTSIAAEDATTIQLHKLREEYDPARPNEYEVVLEERRRRQQEEEERKQREMEKMHEEEDFIPLGEEKPNFSKYPTMEEEVPVEEDEPSVEEKAMRMLEKQGWKIGEGLGKNKQGMTTPLIAKKTAGNTAVIENSALDITVTLPPELVAKKHRETFYNMPPTRILVLLNMVSPQETIDEQLRDEVLEEARNYGKVLNIEICEVKNVPPEETIRIFVEYERKESAVKGFENLYGRFFAGRTITAKFYNEKSFEDRNLYLPL